MLGLSKAMRVARSYEFTHDYKKSGVLNLRRLARVRQALGPVIRKGSWSHQYRQVDGKKCSGVLSNGEHEKHQYAEA